MESSNVLEERGLRTAFHYTTLSRSSSRTSRDTSLSRDHVISSKVLKECGIWPLASVPSVERRADGAGGGAVLVLGLASLGERRHELVHVPLQVERRHVL